MDLQHVHIVTLYLNCRFVQTAVKLGEIHVHLVLLKRNSNTTLILGTIESKNGYKRTTCTLKDATIDELQTLLIVQV